MAQAALLHTASAVYFEHADKKYRYWYTKATAAKPGKLKLHTSKALLAQFRTTRGHGTKVEDLVDICGIGSGWFEITSKDFTNLDELTGSKHDGLKPWLQAWNAYFAVQAQEQPKAVEANKSAPGSHPHQQEVTDRLVSQPRRVLGTIKVKPKSPEPSKLQALVTRFQK